LGYEHKKVLSQAKPEKGLNHRMKQAALAVERKKAPYKAERTLSEYFCVFNPASYGAWKSQS